MMRPSVFGTDRNRDLLAGVDDFLTADEAVGAVHRDGANGVFAKMLRHFENQRVVAVLGFERGQDRRQFAFEGTSTTAPMTWLIVPLVTG